MQEKDAFSFRAFVLLPHQNCSVRQKLIPTVYNLPNKPNILKKDHQKFLSKCMLLEYRVLFRDKEVEEL